MILFDTKGKIFASFLLKSKYISKILHISIGFSIAIKYNRRTSACALWHLSSVDFENSTDKRRHSKAQISRFWSVLELQWRGQQRQQLRCWPQQRWQRWVPVYWPFNSLFQGFNQFLFWFLATIDYCNQPTSIAHLEYLRRLQPVRNSFFFCYYYSQ